MKDDDEELCPLSKPSKNITEEDEFSGPINCAAVCE